MLAFCAAAYVPAEHGVHADVPPAAAVPAAHRIHAACRASGWYDPGKHGTHGARPARPAVPGPHAATQPEEELVPPHFVAVPLGQPMQVPAPGISEYVSTGHSLHGANPGAPSTVPGLYSPGTHIRRQPHGPAPGHTVSWPAGQ